MFGNPTFLFDTFYLFVFKKNQHTFSTMLSHFHYTILFKKKLLYAEKNYFIYFIVSDFFVLNLKNMSSDNTSNGVNNVIATNNTVSTLATSNVISRLTSVIAGHREKPNKFNGSNFKC